MINNFLGGSVILYKRDFIGRCRFKYLSEKQCLELKGSGGRYMDSTRELNEQANLLTRLDKMPIKRSLWLIIILVTIAWLIEGFDTSIISPAVVLLKPLWHLNVNQVGLVGIIGTLGVVIGLIPAGRLSDLFGRKKVLIGGIVVFSIATFLAGFSQNLTQFGILRFVAGLGEGAVFPLPYLMICEFVNRRRRGLAVGVALVGLGFGNSFPTLTTRFALAHYGNDAWRIPLIIGGVCIIIIPFLLKWVPESPRYLIKKGRINEVRKLVLKFEKEAGILADDTIIDDNIISVLKFEQTQKSSFRELLTPEYLKRSFVAYTQLLACFVGFYVFVAYGPTIYTALGATTANAFLFAAVGGFIGGMGNLCQGALSEKFGRRKVQVCYVITQIVGLIILGLHIPSWALVITFIVFNFGAGNFALGKLYVSEQYPTRLRSTGTATGETISRFLAGVVLAYFIPMLLTAFGPLKLFIGLGVVMLLLIAPMALCGRETSGISVEMAGSNIQKKAQKI
jgi:MFS transporter, putative metabolite:H+ symporter